MNGDGSRWPGWQLGLIAAVFIIMLILGLLFQDWLRETLLVPVQYALWVVALAFRSFDQHTIWLMTLGLALALSLIYAMRIGRHPVNRSQAEGSNRHRRRGRVHFWGRQIHQVRNSKYTRRYRYHELTQLVIKTLMLKENMDRKNIFERIRNRELNMPPEVRAIMASEQTYRPPIARVGWLQRWRGQWPAPGQPQGFSSQAPDHRLERLAAYLESLTEETNGF